MTKSSNDKYTDPELRDKIKEEIQDSDKGGKPGQWSARKAQMMAKEYKAQGGGYKDDKKDDKAKHLDQWTHEEWQTKDGDANARSEEGTHRYLPKEAWEKLSESEKEATDQQKLKGSKKGEQYIPNTDKAKRARKEVSDDDKESDDDEEEEDEEDDDEEEEYEGEEEEEEEGHAKPDKEPKAKKARTNKDAPKAKTQAKAKKPAGKKAAKEASPVDDGEEEEEEEDDDEEFIDDEDEEVEDEEDEEAGSDFKPED